MEFIQFRISWHLNECFSIFSGITILCAVGFVINLYFLFHAIPAVVKKELPYRRYLLSINLAIGDIFVQLLSGGIATVMCFNGTIPDLPALEILMVFFVIPGGFSILIFTVYLGLNTFQLIAVKYPVFYKTRLTARHCHLINAFSWILGMNYMYFPTART